MTDKEIEAYKEVVDAAKELRNLVEDSYNKEYDIDSFTLQPMDAALNKLNNDK